MASGVLATGQLIEYEYHEFDMSADTWSVANQQIEIPNNKPTFPWISIAVRSDGDVVVVYAGDTDQVMGGTKERVEVNVRSGSPAIWGGPVALDAAGDNHYGTPNVVKGPLTDDMHIIWQRQTLVTFDPPITWNAITGRTLDPSDTLSTTEAFDPVDTNSAMLGMSNGVSYEDSGTQRMTWAGIQEISGNPRLYLNTTEDGSDDIFVDAGTSGVLDTAGADAHVNGDVGVTTIAELSGDIHQLYSGGGTDGVDADLYYTKSTDDGVTWATPTEEIDAITVNFISANIYVRGIDTVMAYVYDDLGVQKYNEKVLIAGFRPVPLLEQKQNTLLRM